MRSATIRSIKFKDELYEITYSKNREGNMV